MQRQYILSLSALGLISGLNLVAAGPALAAGDAGAGKTAWTQQHNPPGADGPRSCATCHQADLKQTGKQANTGKPIEPMAVSVNPKRLTDPAKVEKWLGRNCRWTLGRDCTDGEKADFLAYIQSQ
jgi:mono/diheme cytochrome c family protein